MDYGNETSLYKLRTPALGDYISPSEEFRTTRIIENELYGGIRAHSGGHGIVRSGNWQLVSSGVNYKAILNEVKAEGKPAIEGFINQIYFYSDESLSWDGLVNGNTYYLYVQLIETVDTSTRLHKKVLTAANTTGLLPADAVLVAVIYVDEPGSTLVDKNPLGRINIPILGDHIADNHDPHGAILNQSFVVCSGVNVQGYLYYKSLEVDNLLISGNGLISGNLTVLGNFTLSGEVIVFGNITFNEMIIQQLKCDNLIVGNMQINSGLDCFSKSFFRKNIEFASGVTVDGFDPSVGIGLIDGSNADSLHTHVLGSLGVNLKTINLSPEFKNTVLSGGSTSGIYGVFTPVRAYDDNMYDWYPRAISGSAAFTNTKIRLPMDFDRLDRVVVRHGVGHLLSGNNINLSIFDKDNTPLIITSPNPSQLSSSGIIDSTLYFSGGNLVAGHPMTIVSRMWGFSGVHTYLGDINLWYVPTIGERIQFEWSQAGAVSAPEAHWDALRTTPYALRVDRVIATQGVGLSGISVFSLNTGAVGATPVNLLAAGEKPLINFNDSGASFQTDSKVLYNIPIPANNIISVSIDSIASGSEDVSVQLIAYRI